MSVWVIKFEFCPVAGWSERSDVTCNPVAPVFVTLKVTVAMMPFPLKASAEPTDVATRVYSPNV